MTPLLVVAGEPSGDRIAASVLDALGRGRVAPWGIGGPISRARGLDAIADAAELAAMGVTDVVRRAPSFATAIGSLLRRARRDLPRAALLVNMTELNLVVGRWLRARGVRVLWCAAPQVWAWRRSRIASLRRAVDRLAVVLPFEEALWRAAEVDARYVGHPALDVPRVERAAVRRRLTDVPDDAIALAVLPGSRPGEIARIAPVLCNAAERAICEGRVQSATILRAPWLDHRSRARLDALAARHRLRIIDADPELGAAPLVGAFDLALCASGTACLETALAGVATIVAYRLDPIAYAIARRLVTTRFVALPNVLLGRDAVLELLQADASPATVARAVAALASDRTRAHRAASTAAELRARLAGPVDAPFGARVAELLADWV